MKRGKLLSIFLALIMVLSLLTPTVFAEGAASYPEGTVIISLDADGKPAEASGQGWTYSDGKLTLTSGSFAVDGRCTAEVYNHAVIVGGTYDGKVYNKDTVDQTKTAVCGTINGGIFNGEVESYHPWVACKINDGIFNGKVILGNNGIINGGTFTDEVDLRYWGTVNGGTFVISYEMNGGSWADGYTAPLTYTYSKSAGIALPTAENVSNSGLIFDGWYDNAAFEGEKLSRIPAKTSGKLTLYAKFLSATATWNSIGNSADESDYTVDTNGNYTVYTAKGLAKIANIVNGGDDLYGKYVTLANDIDLLDGGVDNYSASSVTATNSWAPINGFFGTFDGNGHKISNLYISGTNMSAGLFGSNRGTIKNLEIASGRIAVNILSGNGVYSVGGIASSTTGLIDNCVNNAGIYITVFDLNYGSYAGGITGFVNTYSDPAGADISKVTNCVNFGEISGNGAAYCGGIAGFQFSGRNIINKVQRKTLIDECYNAGSVSAGNSGWGGGIAGGVQSNSVSSSGYTSITATITNCYNSGSVNGFCAGGISGLNKYLAYVYNCYNTGSISGGTNAGGIVGMTSLSAPVIENCYNIGAVTGINMGGIVGNLLSGEVRSCYHQAGSGVGILGSIDTENSTAEDIFEFVSENGTHTLEGSVYGTADLLTALKAWVADHNGSSEYLNWRADELNNNYPVFAKYYVVSFDAVGGTVSPESDTTNDSYTLTALPTPFRWGYDFDGWFTAADGGDEVTPGTVFTKDTTIYAHWTKSSGWSGASDPVYPIIVEDTVNGSVVSDRKTAAAGNTVTVTVRSDANHSLGSLTATDFKGNTIRLIDNGDGTFTFVMPASEVHIRSVFVQGSSPFIDVPENAYYYEAVLWAAEKGIAAGTANGMFSPDSRCTRGQIVTFLWRAAGSPEPHAMSGFIDVSDTSYCAKAVAWAVENGIAEGKGNNRFAPDDPCTRAQAVVFLFRAKAGDAVTLQELVSGYSDSGDVPGYAVPAMNWALYTGVIKGSDGKLLPNDFCTRSQIVTFLWRAYRGR